MVKVLTDSTSYINEYFKKELDIEIISLNVSFPHEHFKEVDIKNEDFYKLMDKNGIPLSSQPSVGDFYTKMKELISKGDSLLGIFLSSEMSGTYSSALMVKDMILEENKGAKIEILDSKSNCMQLGFAAIVAARASKEGKTLEEVKSIVQDNLKRSRFIFVPENLEYLRKGGRIGNASAILGDIFKIIPILTVKDGKTHLVEKIRTKKKAINTLVDVMLKDIDLYGLGEVVVHHINCFNEALSLSKELKKLLNIDIKILDIGPVIGLHVGPGALGIVYYTKMDIK